MTTNREASHVSRISAPASSAKAVTPNDDADLPDGVAKALFVGSGGNVVLIAELDDEATTWMNVPAGSYVSCRVKRVLETTTADDILALY